MSRTHFLFRDVPMDAWIDRYEKSHQNPINRAFHTFGIPMIAVSIPLFLIDPLVRGFWKIPLRLDECGVDLSRMAFPGLVRNSLAGCAQTAEKKSEIQEEPTLKAHAKYRRNLGFRH